jgi:alkanesulfonate monooxygenase SsuD/methylene tetrahydromethanopterin reductase-like flavin-dependent oxidoreductase (luciferase family)
LKFSISISLGRFDKSVDVSEALAETVELVRLAEQGGFETAWAPEHHTIEFTIGPNPFLLLGQWAAHTKTIRMGTGIVTAPYWHPIRLAGEAGLLDVISGGRLEFGIGRGAYQYEFDRMADGMPQERGVAYMKEMVPALKGLWQGDYEHRGEYWNFPLATSVPRPIQKPFPPIWVAARDPGTFDWAIKSGANILSTPLSRPNSEIRILADKFEEALANNPGIPRPRLMMLRRTCVYDHPDGWRLPVKTSIDYGRYFENLFKNIGTVKEGFPEAVSLESVANRLDYDESSIRDAMMFGTPDEIVEKLKLYRDAGVDQFCYGASFGLPYEAQKRSLELFIEKVIPKFQ